MAIWQISFFVIPNRALNNIEIKTKYGDNHCFDAAIFWKDQEINSDIFNSISNFLPQTNSWSESIKMFGNENSNRLEVYFNNNVIESVSFRIDFTSDYEPILRGLIDFFLINGLVILDDKLNLLCLNFETIKKVIENSDQINTYNILSKKITKL